MRAKDAVGRYGEELAVRHLLADGCTLVARNWRTRTGEIDVVVRDGATVVVVEVKTRRDESFGDPLEAITHAKLARLRGLAAEFLRAHADSLGWPAQVRFDAVGVVVPRQGAATVRHVRGVG